MLIDHLFKDKNFLNLQGRKDFSLIFQITPNSKAQHQ